MNWLTTHSNALIIPSSANVVLVNQTVAGITSAINELGFVQKIFTELPDLPLDISEVENLDQIFASLVSQNINYIFCIGGHIAVNNALVFHNESIARKLSIKVIHIPQTAGNDICNTDHCPGYGTIAKTIAQLSAGDDIDNFSFYNGIKINIALGKKSGWIAAATALAKKISPESDNYGPHLIYVPEIEFSVAQFVADIQQVYAEHGRATVVVAEGVIEHIKELATEINVSNRYSKANSEAKILGEYLVNAIKNSVKLTNNTQKIRVRYDIWGYLNKPLQIVPVNTDNSEAFLAGSFAAKRLIAGETGKMLTMTRSEKNSYEVNFGLCDLTTVADKTKTLPRNMLNAKGNGVSPLFFDYVLPLTGPLPKVGSVRPLSIPKQLLGYSSNKKN